MSNFCLGHTCVIIQVMLSMKEIEKLAELARLEIPEEEKEGLRKDIDAILGYVGEIQKISAEAPQADGLGDVYNVFREDAKPHASGAFSKELLKEAPQRDGEYVKVKKIL